MTRFALATRLAWRDLKQHKLRLSFALALFALPIMLLIGYTSLIASASEWVDRSSPATSISVSHEHCSDPGQADCTASDLDRLRQLWGPDHEEFIASLTPQLTISARINNGGAEVFDTITAFSTPPATIQTPNPGELWLADSVAAAMGAATGDTITLSVPDGPSMELTYTGEPRGNNSMMNFADTTTLSVVDHSYRSPGPQAAHPVEVRWVSDSLPSLPEVYGTGVEVQQTRMSRHPGTIFDDIGLAATDLGLATIVISFIMLLVVVTSAVICPVFAVSARRKRRMLGLYAATGARPSDLRNVMLMEGIIVSVLGYLLGLLLSVPMAVIAIALVDAAGTPFHWTWDTALVLLPFVVGCGVGAALIPAHLASRENPVQALEDGTSARMRRFHPAMLVPVALLAYAFIDALAIESLFWLPAAGIGAVLSGPLMVWVLATSGNVLPLTGRIAARDALRNLHRTAPAAAAIAGAVFLTTILLSATFDLNQSERPARNALVARAKVETTTPHTYQETLDWVADRHAVITRADVYQPPTYGHHHIQKINLAHGSEENLASLNNPVISYTPHIFSDIESQTGYAQVIIAEPEILDILRQLHPELISADDATAGKQALSDGIPVVRDPSYLKDGHIRLDVGHYDRDTYHDTYRVDEGWAVPKYASFEDSTTLPAVALSETIPGAQDYGAGAIITPDMATKLGIELAYTSSIFLLEDKVSLTDAFIYDAGVPVGPVEAMSVNFLDMDVITSFFLFPPMVISWLFSIGVVLLIVLLAGAESRRDIDTMSAVGASPTQIRRYTGAQGLVVGLAGLILGTVSSLVPLLALALNNGLNLLDRSTWDSVVPVIFVAFILSIALFSWLAGVLFGARTGGKSELRCRR